jgi:tRNA pseudouridine38-40 synthase
MPRYALKIEYHGGPFAGWQRQAGQPSVQEAVETALRKLEPDAPGIAAAGRTDAGVHARGQVAHCDLSKDWDPFRLSEALNFHLKPDPVAVLAAARVADDWHARFSAVERRYLYRLVARRAPMTLERGLVWRVGHPLAAEPMREAAAHLVGRHDFTTFRSVQCQAESPVKTLDALEIEEVALDHGTSSGSASGRGASCTTRCAASSARSSAWARGRGAPRTCATRSRRGTGRPAGRWRRPRG